MKPIQSYYHLETDRLQFRPIELSDVESWLPFFDNNPSLRFVGMGSDAFKNLSDQEKCFRWLNKQIERKENDQYGQLSVIEKQTGKFIGVAGLIYRNEMGVDDSLEVTYSLLTEAHGKGYGTEAAVCFKDFAFNKVGVNHVVSIIHKENKASKNVAQKNGMSILYDIDDYMSMPVHIYGIKK